MIDPRLSRIRADDDHLFETIRLAMQYAVDSAANDSDRNVYTFAVRLIDDRLAEADLLPGKPASVVAADALPLGDGSVRDVEFPDNDITNLQIYRE